LGEGELYDNHSDAVLPADISSCLSAIDGLGVPYIPLTTGDFGCNDLQ